MLTQDDSRAARKCHGPRLPDGSGEVARFGTIRRLAKALKVTPAELVGPLTTDAGDDAHRDR
jgi:hypothetical protein